MNVKIGRSGAARRMARRGFLGTLGAGGLTAASVIFGRSEPAHAACRVDCCVLEVCPNTSYDRCRNFADYIWGCYKTQSVYCTCCEEYYTPYAAIKCTLD